MSRKFDKLPVHIVEYHNEALEYIYKAIGSKHLPFSGISLLHFDAHPDMIIPDIAAADVFDKQKLFESLSIENWITPALYAGHFDTVVWMKASWAEQICDGNYKFSIGCHRENSKICVSFSDNYFLSECLYADENSMDNQKEVTFIVKSCDVIGANDLRELNGCFKSKAYVLDIDLDFFSTKNPIKIMLGENFYKKLKSLYEFVPPISKEKVDIDSSLKKRECDLITYKSILLGIEQGDHQKWSSHPTFDELCSIYHGLVESLGDEIDASLLHEFGCTTDDPELPHHVSSDAEIESLLVSFETYVASLENCPTVVTISRSSIDDYCPADQVDKIQNLVIDCLSKMFKNIQVFCHYKEN